MNNKNRKRRAKIPNSCQFSLARLGRRNNAARSELFKWLSCKLNGFHSRWIILRISSVLVDKKKMKKNNLRWSCKGSFWRCAGRLCVHLYQFLCIWLISGLLGWHESSRNWSISSRLLLDVYWPWLRRHSTYYWYRFRLLNLSINIQFLDATKSYNVWSLLWWMPRSSKRRGQRR